MSKSKKPKAPKTLVLVNEQGLTVEEVKRATMLQSAAQDVVTSFTAYRMAEGEFKSRFWSLAESLRKPVVLTVGGAVVTRKLESEEITLLLLNLGEIKQRVTEWKRIAEMDEETYAKCRKGLLSKVETLGVARGSLELVEGEGGAIEAKSKKSEDKKPAATATEPEYHKLPKNIAGQFHDIITGGAAGLGLKAQKDGVPYELKGQRSDGSTYLLRLFVDAAAVKPEVE